MPLVHPRKLKADRTGVGNVSVMPRSDASLSRQAGMDPKLVADQLGHGLGVNLDVYTVAALDKRQKARRNVTGPLAGSTDNRIRMT